jgi:superfamily I DNA and/or RNA helicase
MGEEGTEKESKMNVGEADLVIAIYRKLISYGVSSKYIAILTPYSKQVALIKSLIGDKTLAPVDVSTVDGIQGREKECIIISMVRSNSKREIGFLKDWRRMNVAVTRARRMLVLIGNIECVSADRYIHALVHWIEEHGHISSAE